MGGVEAVHSRGGVRAEYYKGEESNLAGECLLRESRALMVIRCWE